MRIPRTALRGPTAFTSFVLAAWLVTGGCATAPPQAYSMQAPQANFGAYKSFTWDAGQGSQAPDEPLTIVNSQIRAAITNELQRKGYAEAVAGAKPDLLLSYETAAAEKVKTSPFRVGVGMGGAGNSGAAGVGVSSSGAKNIREGTLVLRVVDPARNAEVWNGRVSREIGRNGVPDQALIQSAVGDLLREFPAPADAPKQ
jgi:hypothetical protein